MIKFKFNNATIEAPTEWHEVSVEMFCHPYFLTRDAMGMLSALTGIEKHVLMNTKEDLEESLLKMIRFIAEQPEGYRTAKPKTIVVSGIKCKIPKDIELERLGQKIMLQAAMGKHQYIYQAIPEAVAIYLIPELNNGEFDDTMIDDVIEQVKKLRIVDVFPVADFFLNKYRSIIKSGNPS